uniref:protein diaphanous homolog 3-like n=1 Tax=Myxine glutinosa TaxID=7769 RepID=UPI00358F2427
MKPEQEQRRFQLSNEEQLQLFEQVKAGRLTIAQAVESAHVLSMQDTKDNQGHPKSMAATEVYNFSVYKLKKYNKRQKRVLQVNFPDRQVFNIAQGSIHKRFAFADIAACESVELLGLVLMFHRHHDYELQACSAQDKAKILHVFNLILSSNHYDSACPPSYPDSSTSIVRMPSMNNHTDNLEKQRVTKAGTASMRRGGLASFQWIRGWLELTGQELNFCTERFMQTSAPPCLLPLTGATPARPAPTSNDFCINTAWACHSFRVGSRIERDEWVKQINTSTRHSSRPNSSSGIGSCNRLSRRNNHQSVMVPDVKKESIWCDSDVGDEAGDVVDGCKGAVDRFVVNMEDVLEKQEEQKPEEFDDAECDGPLQTTLENGSLELKMEDQKKIVKKEMLLDGEETKANTDIMDGDESVKQRETATGLEKETDKEKATLISPAAQTSYQLDGACLSRSIPPPPPPPPLLPPSGPAGQRMTRSVHWDPVPRTRLQKSLWSKPDPVPAIDLTQLKDLFRIQKNAQKSVAQRARPKVLLNEKMAQNFGIFLRSFPMKPHQLKEALLILGDEDEGGLSDVHIAELRRYEPSPSDVNLYKKHQAHRHKLELVDQYMVEMCEIPLLSERFEMLIAVRELPEQIGCLNKLTARLLHCCDELSCSPSFPAILHHILIIGNTLNPQSVKGFRLNSLNKLQEMRSTDKTCSLLHFLLRQLKLHQQDLLEFPQEIPHIGRSPTASIQGITAELDVVNQAVEKLAKYHKEFTKTKIMCGQIETDFLDELKDKISELQSDVCKLQEQRSQLHIKYSSLMVWFGEPQHLDSEEFFGWVQDFHQHFLNVLKEEQLGHVAC